MSFTVVAGDASNCQTRNKESGLIGPTKQRMVKYNGLKAVAPMTKKIPPKAIG